MTDFDLKSALAMSLVSFAEDNRVRAEDKRVSTEDKRTRAEYKRAAENADLSLAIANSLKPILYMKVCSTDMQQNCSLNTNAALRALCANAADYRRQHENSRGLKKK